VFVNKAAFDKLTDAEEGRAGGGKGRGGTRLEGSSEEK
jgi:hypothetical protein